VNGREPAGQHPVHLLREGLVSVTSAEAGLDVARRDALEECREGRGKAGHRVALDQQNVGPDLTQ
jgi:hypothetical protein